MVTYFLGREEVSAYLRDFLSRLQRFDPLPTLWCPLTRSGNALLSQLLDLVQERYPDLAGTVSVLPIEVGDGSGTIRFLQGDPAKDIPGRSVLVFDGSVHSGQMLTNCVTKILNLGATQVCTYSLVIKRGSKFVPTLWGLTIDDVDRAFFLLEEIPNNRLDAGSPRAPARRTPSYIHIRVLGEADLQKPTVTSGLRSIDRVTWGDRYFDMKAGGDRRCSYVLEEGAKILGFLTLSHPEPDCLSVDEVAVDPQHRGRNLGAVLIRFADTMARHFDCRKVRLHAIKERIGFYEGFGYALASKTPVMLDEEEYQLMEKLVVYNRSLLY